MRGTPLPIVVLSTMDVVARDTAAFSLMIDQPGAVLVRHDLTPDDDGEGGRVRRLVTDAGGVVWDDSAELGHACLSCAVREDIVPTLQRVVAAEQWTAIVLALPLTAAPEPVVHEIAAAIDAGVLGARIATSITVCDPDTLVDDLFGDELLVERGAGLAPEDQRSVGEALAAQLDFADVVATLGPAGEGERAVLDHLIAPTARWAELSDIAAADLFGSRHDLDVAHARVDPLGCDHGHRLDDLGVWTLELATERPLHPGRLMEQIELLGSGLVRGRGCFWLPTRPDQVCVWDGAGGQLAIGPGGLWAGRPRRTRLIITGINPDDRERIQRAFADVVLTDFEAARMTQWRGRPDAFGPWLGGEEREVG